MVKDSQTKNETGDNAPKNDKGDARRYDTDFDDIFFASDDRQQFVIDALTNSFRHESIGGGLDTAELREELLHWIQETVRRDPKRMGGILLPIIGPVIRQMITDRLQTFMENTTAMLDMYASPAGLRLRWQAIRTGVPLSRLILLNMFVFRVDSVIMIHSKTDMVIKDLHRSRQPIVDSDAIGAMLSAISKFIDDSFGIQDGIPIKDIRLGDYHVWLFSGPVVNLACVVYGSPDAASRRKIVSVLEDIHAIAGKELMDYPKTDIADSVIMPLLKRGLVERRDQKNANADAELGLQDTEKSDSNILKSLTLILGLLFVVVLAWNFNDYKWNKRVSEVEALIESQAGLIPIKLERNGKDLELVVMQDKASKIPVEEIAEIGFPANRLTVIAKPYDSGE